MELKEGVKSHMCGESIYTLDVLLEGAELESSVDSEVIPKVLASSGSNTAGGEGWHRCPTEWPPYVKETSTSPTTSPLQRRSPLGIRALGRFAPPWPPPKGW